MNNTIHGDASDAGAPPAKHFPTHLIAYLLVHATQKRSNLPSKPVAPDQSGTPQANHQLVEENEIVDALPLRDFALHSLTRWVQGLTDTAPAIT